MPDSDAAGLTRGHAAQMISHGRLAIDTYIIGIYSEMLNLAEIEGFDWDEGNQRKSEEKHGVSQTEAEQVFISTTLLVLEDVDHSQSEPRFHALGTTEAGRLLHVTFTVRAQGKKIRVISARDMNRKERMVYEEKSQADS